MPNRWPLTVGAAALCSVVVVASVASCGCFLWLLPVVASCGCFLWLLPVVASCGCSLWLLPVVASCGCFLWCRIYCHSLTASRCLCVAPVVVAHIRRRLDRFACLCAPLVVVTYILPHRVRFGCLFVSAAVVAYIREKPHTCAGGVFFSTLTRAGLEVPNLWPVAVGAAALLFCCLNLGTNWR